MEYKIINGNTAEIKFYGRIADWWLGANDYIATLSMLEAKQITNVNIRVHCVGGDVLEGAAIWAANKRSKLNIDFYVDGVAASMMPIVMLSGRDVYMSSLAKVMIHAPKYTGGGGSKQLFENAKLLKKIEQDFINVFASKTNKTIDEVKVYMDGNDYWFNAQDCVQMGLAKAITSETVFTTPVPTTPDAGTTAELVFSQYTAINEDANFSTIINMDKKLIIAKYGLTGLNENSSDTAIMDAVQAKLDAQLQANANLQQQAAQAVTTQANAVIAAKEVAIGFPFTAEQKQSFVAFATSNGIAQLNTLLEAVKPVPNIGDMLTAAGGANPLNTATAAIAADRANWSFSRWEKEDPQGLEAMEANNIEAFKKLYNAEFKDNKAVFE